MGSGEGKNRSLSGLDYLQNLIPNVNEQLNSQHKAQLSQLKLEMPKIQKDYQTFYNFFKSEQLDFDKHISEEYEHLNILSPFQIKLLEPQAINSKFDDEADQLLAQLKIKQVKSLRLLDLKSIEQYSKIEHQDVNWLSMQIKGITNYCILVLTLLKACKTEKELSLIVYVAIWEHFSSKLIKLSEQNSFQKVNQAFDAYFFTNLKPSLKLETLGAKLWGEYVEFDQEFAINTILEGRLKRESQLPLAKIAKVVIERSTDSYNLLFAGGDDFEKPKLIKQLEKQTLEIYETEFSGDYQEFLRFWFQDSQYILTIIPEWIVENYLYTILFDFLEEQFYQQILKLTQEELQQINNIQIQEIQIYPINFEQIGLNEEGQLNLDNLLTYDQFLKSQLESTISVVSKRASNEKKSDILKSNTTTNDSGLLFNHQQIMQQFGSRQIGEQVSSDIQSEGSKYSSVYLTRQSKIKNLSLDELQNIMNYYDTIKFPIISKIEARKERVRMKNQKITKVNYEYRCLFSFEKSQEDITKKAENFCQSLLNNNGNQVESLFIQKEYVKSIAEMLQEL